MYLTPAQLTDGPDSLNELSELFGLAPALLSALIRGGAVDAWQADEVQRGRDALTTIAARISQASSEIDARLAVRGYPLPQDAQRFPILTVWARAIARYHLHPQREGTQETTGRIERDYKDALRALREVAEGTLSLGAGDPVANNSAPASSAVRVQGNARIFNRGTLGGL